MKTVRKRSQKQEKGVAKDMGAKVVVASGALWSAKGDVRSDKFLIECKTTEKDYYPVTTKVWEKISQEAVKDGMRTPLLMVDLKDSERYVIFNPKDFNRQFNTYVIAGGKVTKTYRLREWEDVSELPILFGLSAERADKVNHILMCWTIDKFKDYFEEEL